jgi:hypothetical protein
MLSLPQRLRCHLRQPGQLAEPARQPGRASLAQQQLSLSPGRARVGAGVSGGRAGIILFRQEHHEFGSPDGGATLDGAG